MAWDAIDFTRQLEACVNAFDRPGAAALCNRLVDHLIGGSKAYPPKEAEKVLDKLRRKRFFDLMQDVGDAFIQTERSTPKIWRQYAQCLIDQGNLTAALCVLNQLVVQTAEDPTENAEARGLVGRVYKQRYLNANKPKVTHNRHSLEQAVQSYLEVYRRDPEQHVWHGINVAALVVRGQRDGLSLADTPDPKPLATEILGAVKRKNRRKRADFWDCATAVEACLALRDADQAVEWLDKYLAHRETDAFELASTLRQLEEVWRLDADRVMGPLLLPPLRAALLQRQGGRVDLVPELLGAEGSQLEANRPHLEKVFGATAFKPLTWYQTGLQRANAVARIGVHTTRGVGTGFLVRGKDLHSQLGDGLVLLTNAHVVSEDSPDPETLTPDDATVVFEAVGTQTTHRVAELVWSSPPEELDATVLRLQPHDELQRLEPCPVARRLPLADSGKRVYVVGHPGGGTLCFSLQDNLLLDHDGRKLHYRAPTEGGSSGSPVFNETWELVALHHAGDVKMPKLKPKTGTYEANEGIAILAIRQALDEAVKSGAIESRS